ncbi:aspartate 1-decarboxylase [Bradyrhizobium sp. CCBAU 25338]|uniref:aspartate 1-decarboxylase n=1 Tax=Bradyrhizobium sp. CCBAU 25338 TaxID=1641877 RepID=UPI003FA4D4E8
MRRVLAGKVPGLRVAVSNLNYSGSIALDPDHCHEAGILSGVRGGLEQEFRDADR